MTRTMSVGDTVALPAKLEGLDGERMRRYRQNLAFYRGQQWQTPARRGERRLTFNYARAFVDKVTSYLLNGQSVQVVAHDGSVAEDRARARQAELALRAVEAETGIAQLDFESELDCAILGDGAYRVTWDAREGRVRVSAPDVQSLWAWRDPADMARLTAVAWRYLETTPDGESTGDWITEHWTASSFGLWRGTVQVEASANPYGFIPFVVFPNVREPKEAWGASDIPPLMESSRELNRAYSQLSQILELSGNPVAVLEGVSYAEGIAVEPGAVWEVPEKARAYLLDLLQGGGAALHTDYIDLVYRTLHDLGEAPRTAFGSNPQGLSGVALNTELDPIARKVTRKQLLRSPVYERRATLILRLLAQFTGLDITGLRTSMQWGPILPVDRSREVSDVVALVGAGVQSRRTSAGVLGADDPEAEWARVLEERA